MYMQEEEKVVDAPAEEINLEKEPTAEELATEESGAAAEQSAE